MHARSGRALPGVFISMLVASSVLVAPTPAAASTDAAPPARKSAGHEQRRPLGNGRAQSSAKPAPHKAIASATRRRPQTAPTSHVTSAQSLKPLAGAKPMTVSYVYNGHSIAAPITKTSFIDDGFTYTEDAGGHVGWTQTGVASWYGGRRWQGNVTASGDRYNESVLTAAHATLPLGSRVRVTLANSDRSVVVIINDRPGTRTRIIDLSRGAAEALGILSQGVAVVTLSPIS